MPMIIILENQKLIELKKRIFEINPLCKVNAIREYYTPDNASHIISSNLDYVIDAIDKKNQKNSSDKLFVKKGIFPLLLAVESCEMKKLTASQIRNHFDLGESDNDPLLSQMRKQLRRDLGLKEE